MTGPKLTDVFSARLARVSDHPLWILSVILGVFVVLSLWNWHLPGVYYDEVILTNQAYDILDGTFPVIGNVSYVGSLKGYLHAPFVAAFPGSVFWLRLVPVGLTVATGVLYFQLIRRATGSASGALWGVGILLFHPVVWMSVRADDGPVSTQMFLMVAVLLFLQRGVSTHRGREFLFAGLCLGLGLWQKASFGGLLLMLICVLPFWFRLNRQHICLLGLFGLGVGLGSAPIVVYHMLHDWNLPHYASRVGGEAELILPKVAKAWEILIGVERVQKITHLQPKIISLTLLPVGAAILFSLWNGKVRALVLWLLGVVVFLMCSVLPHVSGTNARHFVLLFPWIPLVIVLGWVACEGRPRAILGGLMALALATQGMGILHTLHALEETEGVWFWSNASQDLHGALAEDPERMTVCMDWGIRETQRYLSGDSLPLMEQGWIYSNVNGGREAVLELMRTYPDARWVFHTPGREVFPYGRRLFQAALKTSGYREVVESEVRENSGAVLYRISSVEAPIRDAPPEAPPCP